MTIPKTVVARAHAKINLDLRVLGTRADGFHELRTVFQSVALHDTVTCVARPGPFVLSSNEPRMPVDRTNLVWKAAERFWRALRRTGEVSDVAVHVEKAIPMEAGLGGGSADAAATLIALARLWQPALRPPQLVEVAGALGADVPFFLSGGTALGLGRGDEIYPLVDLPRHWVVLLVPEFGVATSDAYGWYDADRAQGVVAAREPQFVPGPWPSRAAQLVNDLEAAVARRHPEIDRMRQVLKRQGAAAAMMSGSGSTVFGLFQRRIDAQQAIAAVEGTGWRPILAPSLGRPEFGRRARPVLLRGEFARMSGSRLP